MNKKRTEFSLIYSSSDSSVEEKSFKLPLICLINFSQCIYTLLKTLADNNSHLFLGAEFKQVTAKQVWLESLVGISLL